MLSINHSFTHLPNIYKSPPVPQALSLGPRDYCYDGGRQRYCNMELIF